MLNTDLLAPFDIKHLGQVLFQLVQFRVFEDNWRQVPDKTAADNMRLPQADPRYAVGVDALMGKGIFSNPDVQATWDPRILE